jgi:thiamine-phosphate pyrophosphorylase
VSAPDFRLIVITDAKAAAPRSIEWVVREALAAGAPAIQLRDKNATSAELLEQARRLHEITSKHDALLFINDRLDVALLALAEGVHLGPDDLPLDAAHGVSDSLLIGISTDSPEVARTAAGRGAAYVGCGAVFGTRSKAEVADERIGPEGLRRVVEATTIPVVGIGGVTPENVELVAAAGAAGCAVIQAVMSAERPGHVVAALLRAFQ